MNNILKLSFWFDTYPKSFTPIFFWSFLALFVVAIVFGIFCFKKVSEGKTDKVSRKVWRSLRNLSFSMGIVGLILIFFKQQQSPYLGMRIWLIVWLLICLIWLIFILRYLLVNVPKIKKEELKQEAFNKYLP